MGMGAVGIKIRVLGLGKTVWGLRRKEGKVWGKRSGMGVGIGR